MNDIELHHRDRDFECDGMDAAMVSTRENKVLCLRKEPQRKSVELFPIQIFEGRHIRSRSNGFDGLILAIISNKGNIYFRIFREILLRSAKYKRDIQRGLLTRDSVGCPVCRP